MTAATSGDRRTVAVVGAGVAGLTAAYILAGTCEVTLYEADERLGGHAHTHDVADPAGTLLAVDTGFIEDITDADIQDGLDAAAAVGDDRIQQQTQGQVDPESWTHGSAEQRQSHFLVGFNQGSVEACQSAS